VSEKQLLRPSEINCYLKCGAQYMFRYIEKLEKPLPLVFAFGTSVHAALEKNYRQKIQTRVDIPVQEVVQEFADRFDVETIAVDVKELRDDPKAKDIGVTLVQRYQAVRAPSIQPAEVEYKAEVTYAGYDYGITGTMDVLTETGVIHDHKTASKRNNAINPAHALQGNYYFMLAQALKRDPKSVQFDYLVKTANPQFYTQAIPLDVQHALIIAQSVGDGIRAGVFIPNRSSYLCTRRFCSYWVECEKKYGGRVAE
jgi:hypothetical protein